MPDNYTRPRFELPGDWSPSAVWCVVLHIPGDTEYVEILNGLLDDLTWSKYHERDDTKTGAATVARTWAAALATEPIRIIDCQIIIPPPPTPDDDAAGDVAATIIQVLYQWIIQQIIDCIAEEVAREDCIDNIMVQLGPYYAGEAARAALLNVFDGVEALAAAARAVYATDCPYNGLYNDLKDSIIANDTWLDHLADWLFDRLQGLSDGILAALDATAAALTGQGVISWVNAHGGVVDGSGAGFGETDACPWVHTFDFRDSDGGFVPALWPDLSPMAIWLNGLGWRSTTYVEHGEVEFQSTALYATWEYPPFRSNRFTSVYTLDYGTTINIPANDKIFYVYQANLQPFMAAITEGSEIDYDTGVQNVGGEGTLMTMRCYTGRGPLGFSEPGVAILHEMTFYGVGYNPFATGDIQ